MLKYEKSLCRTCTKRSQWVMLQKETATHKKKYVAGKHDYISF